MSNTKSNSDTLIASFLLPWKVTNHATGKEQPNNHKKPCAWILPVLQCLQNPRGLSLFQGKFSQKVKKPKKNRLFEFFEFFGLFDFSIFRLFDFFDFFDFSSRNLLACRLFDFSRANIVIFTVWPIPARRAHRSFFWPMDFFRHISNVSPLFCLSDARLLPWFSFRLRFFFSGILAWAILSLYGKQFHLAFGSCMQRLVCFLNGLPLASQQLLKFYW